MRSTTTLSTADQGASNFTDESVGQTGLCEKDVAASGEGLLTRGIQRPSGQRNHRLRLCPGISAQPAHELETVE